MIVRFLKVPELNIPRTVDHAGISTMTIGVTAALLGISLAARRVGPTRWSSSSSRSGRSCWWPSCSSSGVRAEPIVPMYLYPELDLHLVRDRLGVH
jgi:hypothetical protein